MYQIYNRSDLLTQIARMMNKAGDATWVANEAAQALQMAHRDIARAGEWPVLYKVLPWSINLIATYDTGTVTVTLDSTTVTGSGTVFTSAMIGRKFRVGGDDRYYIITAVASGTSLTINDAYENDDIDGAGKAYKIYQDEYNLPIDFGLCQYMRLEAQGEPLTRQNLALFYRDNPTADGKGDPLVYEFIETGVENQPVSASVLALSSSSVSDDTKSVIIRGVVSNMEDYEEVTLGADGTVNTTKSFSRVDKIAKNIATAWVGRLTITANSAAITVHRLPPEFVSVTVRKVRFYPFPKTARKVYIGGWRDLFPLLRDYDVPEVSHDLYIHGGTAYALQMKGEWEKAKIEMQIFHALILTERAWQYRDFDHEVDLRRDTSYKYGTVT